MSSGTERRWFVPALIVLAVPGLLFMGSKLGVPASAQVELPASSDGKVLVVPIQIGRDSHGLAMVDTASQTLWIYKVNGEGPADNRLRLLAARSWRYDKLLQRYNTGEPNPEQVKMLLQNLGQLQNRQNRERQEQTGSGSSILEMAEPDAKL